MPSFRVFPEVVAAIVCSGSIAFAAPVPQATVTPQQPTVAFELFSVDAATGALTPLEVIKTKTEGGSRSWYTYLPGAASTVALPYGEPLAFAVRTLATPEAELKNPLYRIERLAVKNGKRYATQQFVTLEVTTYGQPIGGLDPDKKKNRLAYAYLFTPRFTLPPGEYALTIAGVTSTVGQFGTEQREGGAFRIVEMPRAPQPAAPPAPPTQEPTTAPSSPTDIESLTRAATQGDVAAQIKLASAYATGTGVPQDYLQTNQWLRKAADRGSAEAQYWLAVMYRDSIGVAPDPAEAAQLFRKAAEQGHPQAQGNLGNFYFLGRGVLQDYVEAHKWLNIACTRLTGDELRQGVELRDKVAAQMTPAQMAEAQKRAVDWIEAFRKRTP